MVYIFVNKYDDAQSFIKKFKMKKIVDVNIFQVFKADGKNLTITKGGVINMAVAVSRTFTLFPPDENADNIALYIGFVEKNFSHGESEIFIANKIHDGLTKRDFYPNIIYKHRFAEIEIESFTNQKFADDGIISDEESGAFYQTTCNFLPNHSIIILKMLKSESIEEIMAWVDLIEKAKLTNNFDFTEEEKILLIGISENLRLSETLKHDFLKVAKKHKIRNGDFIEIIREYENLKIKNKSERDICYGGLLEKLNI